VEFGKKRNLNPLSLSLSLVLSIAYETLSNPSSKLLYDVSKHKGTSTTSSSFVSSDDDNPNDTLQRVLHQVNMKFRYYRLYYLSPWFNSFLTKCWMESFKPWEHLYVNTLISHLLQWIIWQLYNNYIYIYIDALNETNPGMHITEDAILQIELGFRKMRELFQCKVLFVYRKLQAV